MKRNRFLERAFKGYHTKKWACIVPNRVIGSQDYCTLNDVPLTVLRFIRLLVYRSIKELKPQETEVKSAFIKTIFCINSELKRRKYLESFN